MEDATLSALAKILYCLANLRVPSSTESRNLGLAHVQSILFATTRKLSDIITMLSNHLMDAL